MSSNYCKTPELMNSVLNEIEKSVKNNIDKQFSDEDLVTLHSVFGTVLQHAFDILEKHPLLEVYTTAKKTRYLVEVKGDRDHCYRIFPRVNFCPCPAFKHQVLDKKVQVTCKHVLAGRIARILNKTTEHEINQDQYQMLVCSMFEFE